MIPIDKAVISRVNKIGKRFEILVDPNAAQNAKNLLKEGKNIDMSSILAIEDIFEDSRKGKRASKKDLESAFETSDIIEVAEIILKEGTINTTSEQRDKEKDDKWKRIVALIAMNAVDARTLKPVPQKTIEDALHQSKFNVDERKVDDQLNEAIKSVKKIIPIKFEERVIQVVNVAPHFAGTVMEICKKIGRITRETWNQDRSVTATISVPAGLREELMNKINDATRGKIDMKLLD